MMKEDWSKVVWDLIHSAMVGRFRRKNIGIKSDPRLVDPTDAARLWTYKGSDSLDDFIRILEPSGDNGNWPDEKNDHEPQPEANDSAAPSLLLIMTRDEG